MRTTIFLVAILLSRFVPAQDTLRVMHYNLLYYGVNTSFCTASNNNIDKKDNYLRTIMEYVRPDILTVNEISRSPAIHQHLLDQVLNTGGIYYYRKADFLSQADSEIANMLYYNSNKLVLKKHLIVQHFIRDIDLYELYYRSSDLENGDTAFIICVVGHLKAGTGTSNENYRKIMAENTMDFLNDYHDEANYLLMGDFNIYSASEPAYQEFLFHDNPALRFRDPIDAYGNWHSNYAYRHLHTQSTDDDGNGCKSGGGSDDRFDFILASGSVMDDDNDVKYIGSTYRAIGQDGLHFNGSINAMPVNTSVPFDVLSALFANSDHLPVTLDLEIDKILNIYTGHLPDKFSVTCRNPASGKLKVKLKSREHLLLDMEILDYMGRVRYRGVHDATPGDHHLEIPLTGLPTGNYLLRIRDRQGQSVVKKFLII